MILQLSMTAFDLLHNGYSSPFILFLMVFSGIVIPENTIPLYYHMDHMGSSEFLTSDVTKRITSWTSYDEWGNITHKYEEELGVF